MVVVDTMPMEITGYADVVLPECTYLERYDGIRSATKQGTIHCFAMPAVAPRFDSKPAWWMAKQLGEKLGLQDYFNYDDYKEVIAWQLKEMGTSLEEMEKIGVKNSKENRAQCIWKKVRLMNSLPKAEKSNFILQNLERNGFDPMPNLHNSLNRSLAIID